MPRRVCPSFWVVAYIGIGIHPTRVGLGGVGPHKASTHRVVVAEAVVEQARLAIEALPGEVVGGGHRPLAVAHCAIGRKELHRLRTAAAGESDGAAAQHVGEQVGERTVSAHRHALTIDVVVFGRGDGAPTEHRFAVAIEGDGVGHSAIVHPLQHVVACVVVEEPIRGRGATGRRPTGQASFVVIAHQRPGGAAATGVSTAGIRVATGHVAHGIIAGIRVGYAAQRGGRMHMIDVAIGDAACRTAGHAIQAVIAEGLLVGRERGARGRVATVVSARGCTRIACPDEPTQGIDGDISTYTRWAVNLCASRQVHRESDG